MRKQKIDRPRWAVPRPSSLYGSAREVVLGGVTFEHPRIGLSRATSGSSSRSERDGILGNDLLRQYLFDVDYRHSRLVLIKPGD